MTAQTSFFQTEDSPLFTGQIAGKTRMPYEYKPQPRPAAPVVSEVLPSVYSLRLVRDGDISDRPQISCPQDAVHAFNSVGLADMDREHLMVMFLSTKNRVIGISTVAVGGINAASVAARELFKAAVLANAAFIIMAHNHPSGDPNPSPEDHSFTRFMADNGKNLGIDVLDHVVVGDNGRFVSLKERGVLS